ncbi:MAG: GAF domain-containing protein, partial [Actinobacteria bacterium]|nr:GAF domain-containing protein [Actinomycetota bacterium]
LVLAILFGVCGITFMALMNFNVFKEYFQGEVFIWILRGGIILLIISMVVYFVMRERSHRTYAEGIFDRIVEANYRLKLLLDAGRELGSTLDLDQILEQILGYALAEAKADMGAVYLWEKEADVLKLAVSRGVDKHKVMFKEFPMGKGLMGEAASRREITTVDDTKEIDERDNVFFGAAQPGSQVIVPLLSREKFVGVLVIGSEEAHEYTVEVRRLLEGLAELAGLAVANAELYRIARRSLDALSRQRGVTGSVLDEMVAGVITSGKNGRIDVFNREAQRLTGYSLSEMAQARLRPDTNLEENPLGPLEHGMLKVISSPEVSKEGEALIMKKDRTVLPVSYRIYPLVSGGEIEGAAAVFMEAVTDAGDSPRKDGVDYQVLLRSLGARIERLYTHPLSRVIESVRRIDADEWAQSKDDVVRTLEAGSSALLELLEDIEGYLNCVTVREWDSPGENDLGEIVTDVVANILRPPEHAGTSVVAKLAGIPKVFGYERMVRLALEEVIENAVIAADEGGKRVEVTGRELEGMVRLEVRDNGPGVSTETVEYMYLPFFTNREGSPGLGLSTARRVMWRLGGRVGIEEGTGDGAMFFLEFPTSPRPIAQDGG